MRADRDKQTRKLTHAEEGTGGIKEVKVQHGDQCHPQVGIAECPKGPGQSCLASIRECHNILEEFKALNTTCTCLRVSKHEGGGRGTASSSVQREVSGNAPAA